MGERRVETGEVVYHEGDVPDFAYVVLSGSVEMVEVKQGNETQIRIIDAGKTFGEYALFDPWALRPFTIRALEPTVLQTVTVEEFKGLLNQCPKALMPFLMLSFEKMKSTKVKERPTVAAVINDISKIIFTAATDKLREQFKPIEVPLARLPFRIGGYPEGGEPNRRDQLHLYIASIANPLRVSRQHCEIMIENKGLVIADLGSRFGTIVNGVGIGRARGAYKAPLKKGVNDITLGAKDGPYKITIRCD